MIELERHIETLLLSHDCVIVPGLGGFVAHYVDARFDEGDNTYLPPLRTLGFNGGLTLNDSLLVQSYVEAFDLSYPDALARIQKETEELRGILDNQGYYEFSSLGILRYNDEGNLEFEPSEAGILTPRLYGLGGVEITPLSQLKLRTVFDVDDGSSETSRAGAQTYKSEAERIASGGLIEADDDTPASPRVAQAKAGPEEAVDDGPDDDFFGDDDEEEASVKIPLRVIHYAAAAVIAFMVFAFTMPSVGNGEVGEMQTSAIQNGALHKLLSGPAEYTVSSEKDNPLNANNIDAAETNAEAERAAAVSNSSESESPAAVSNSSESGSPAGIKTAEAASAKSEAVKSEAPVAVNEAKTEPAAETVATPKTFYTLVLASRITKANGQTFANQLAAKGVKGVRVHTQKSVNRVICGRYSTEAEAYNALRQYRNNTPDFSEAWVFKAIEE